MKMWKKILIMVWLNVMAMRIHNCGYWKSLVVAVPKPDTH